MKLVVTQIQRSIDGLERLKINVDLPFLSLGGNDFTTINDEAIRRHLVVQLQTLLSGCDCRQHRLTVDS